jgi:hypothetical protein
VPGLVSDTLFPVPVLPKDERAWQTVVQKALKREEYAWQHVYRLKTADGKWRTSTTASGWPDLVAFGHGAIIAMEVKGKDTPTTPAQLEWLHRFLECGAYAWRLRVIMDWQLLANMLAFPEDAPRRYGW